MNLVAFGLILICCHAWAIEIDDNFLVNTAKRTKLEEALENLKSSIRNGDSSLGIPPLDPFVSEKLPYKVNESNINVEGLLTNVKVDGLSSYQVNSANFKIFGLKANMDLSWPLIVANTNYTIKGNALGFDIYGTGGVYAAVHDFRFSLQISLKLKGKYVQIKSVSTKVSLGALDFKITGLYNDEESSKVISKTISDMVPKWINENQKMLTDNINSIIMQTGNKFLSTITLKELLKMLGL